MSMNETVLMFRPTGPEELLLVERSGFKAWPPRLPDQPIFYPVTNEEYSPDRARVECASQRLWMRHPLPGPIKTHGSVPGQAGWRKRWHRVVGSGRTLV